MMGAFRRPLTIGKTMKDVAVEYNGRMVSKKYFRAFVYNKSGDKKLANSWDEYGTLVGSGVWFISAEAASATGSHKDKQEHSDDKVLKKDADPTPKQETQASTQENKKESKKESKKEVSEERAATSHAAPKASKAKQGSKKKRKKG